MSQHDFNIANQGFPATRADLNNALAALASTSSGDTEPSTTYANQLWYDTANNLLKFRNEADSAWITFAYLDQASNEWEIRSAVIQAVDSAGVVIKTDDGTTRLTVADDGSVTFANDVTVTGTTTVDTLNITGASTGTDLTLSGGVYLGGTGAANYLDDYEEGTWTGSVSVNGFTQTVSSIAGTYTKIGRLVNIHYLLTLSSAGYASGYSLWTGLPFTAASTSQAGGYYATGSISINVIGSTHFVVGNSANIYLFQSTSTTSTTTWQGSFSYYTA